jgi:hypothetical protein
MLVSSFNEGPEVERLPGVSEIVRVAVILGVNRKIVGDLTVSFFLLEGRICQEN